MHRRNLIGTPYALRARRRARWERCRKVAFWSLAAAMLAASVLDFDETEYTATFADPAIDWATTYPARIVNTVGPCYDCEGDPRFADEVTQ
jgi:hypothetical protein